MKLDKFGRFVDIWDWALNLIMPKPEPVEAGLMTMVEHMPNGTFEMTMTRNGIEAKYCGFGYDDVYNRTLEKLKAKEK